MEEFIFVICSFLVSYEHVKTCQVLLSPGTFAGFFFGGGGGGGVRFAEECSINVTFRRRRKLNTYLVSHVIFALTNTVCDSSRTLCLLNCFDFLVVS